MWQQTLRLGLVLAGLSMFGGDAQAQGSRGGGFRGGDGFRGGGFGLFPFFPGYGWGPTINNAMGGYFPGYGGYGPGSFGPYYFGGYYTTFTVPGWAASGTGPSDGWYGYTRGTLFPAVAVSNSSPLVQVDGLPAGARAALVLAVPTAQSQVWVQGKFTTQQGLARRFTTPELKIGKEYEFDLIAQWTDGQGKVQTARRTITIHAGDEVHVAFTPNLLETR